MEDQCGDCFEVKSIPFNNTNLLNSLTSDYLYTHKTNQLFAFKPNLDGIEEALKVRQNIKIPRQSLVDFLQKQYQNTETSNEVKNNIKLLQKQNTFTITTGHQLNLFTGPAYFFYKIYSVIKLAEIAGKKFSDFQFVPVFWMASEDHDFDEVKSTFLLDKKFTWQKNASGAVGDLGIEGLAEIWNEFKKYNIQNNQAKEFYDAVEGFLQTSSNYARFVFNMVNYLFKQHGLVVLDANSAELKSHLISVMKEDIFHQKTFKAANNTRQKLEEGNYKEQIFVREINFFYLHNRQRERIEKHADFYKVINTNISFSESEMMHEINHHPEKFSPNVALRPVYQETILPNVAYIGGGAEVAYWLQLHEVFKQHNTFFPVVLHRDSAVVIAEKTWKKLNQLGLTVQEIINTSADELLKNHAINNTTHNLNLHEEMRTIQNLFDHLKQRVTPIQQTLQRTVEGEKVKILNRLASVEKKLLREEKKKHQIWKNQLNEVVNSFYPNGTLQERKINFLSFYFEYGSQMEKTILQSFNAFENSLKVIVTKQ